MLPQETVMIPSVLPSAKKVLFLLSFFFIYSLPGYAQNDVLTWHNDVARTGQNLSEAILTPALVNSTNFGLIANVVVDGKVDAQPLYASALTLPGQGTHNILYIATENASVYAMNADSGTIYWQKSLLGTGEVASDDRNCGQVAPEIGVTATPVIDRSMGAHGTIFLVAMSKDASGNYYQRIHALDLTTGAEQANSPVLVQATYPGTGDGSANGVVSFAPGQYKERPGLLVVNGTLYTSWGSHCDIRPYAGWLMAYSESSLKQTSVLDFAPNGNEVALWNAGAGPAADASGNLYVALANGTFDTTLTAAGFPSGGDYGNAVAKVALQSGKLNVLDYWTMYNSNQESSGDVDLGSGGLMLIPNQVDSTGATRHLAVAAGKDSNLYLVDQTNMGHYDASNDGTIYQQLSSALPGGVWSSPAYFNGSIYYGSVGSNLRAFQFSQARLVTTAEQTTSTTFAYPGTTPSISAYGAGNGIVWATENTNPAILHAYEAGNLDVELYNTNQATASRDHFGAGNKYIVPTIVNGKVYVGTMNSVGIFGFIRKSTPPIPDGPYVMTNANSLLVLDDPGLSTVSGVAMYQWAANGGLNQKWFFSFNGSGYYTIQNVSSKLFLTDPGSASSLGLSLEQNTPLNTDAQLWSLTSAGGGTVIKNKATGLVIDDSGLTKAEGAHIILWTPNGGINQSWTLN
jgi:Ricin-type beta-trefoil lectin domain-like